jgi:K+-sensing histidine kinase KdpD
MTSDSVWWLRMMRTTADTPRALRAVRYLIWSSWLVFGVVAVYMALPGSEELRTPPRLVFMAAALAVTLVLSLLPWPRLAEGRRGLGLLLAWVVADVIALSFGVALSGGTASPFFILYSVVPIFLATAFPQWTQGLMLLLSCSSLLVALLLTGGRIVPKILVIKMGVIGVVTAIAVVVTHELSERARAHKEALEESERRAQLLAKLAAAARDISQLGPDEVLEAVVEAVMDLGFASTFLAVIDHDTQTHRIVAARGLNRYVGTSHSTRSGIAARILQSGDIVITSDGPNPSGTEGGAVEESSQAAIGAPIWCDGELSATLVARFNRSKTLSPEEIETFELLADQAGHALSNARKFELERASVERLQELDRMKSEFIATVSHEIRTPLTAIAGIGSTLHLRWNALDESQRREFLLRLNANASVLDEIISMLLDFSRLESGVLRARLDAVDLDELVASTLHRLDGLVSGHNVVSAIDPDLRVRADRMLLDRVVENLISNACKHTPTGTNVRMSARRTGDGIEVSVEDEGPGMPDYEVARLGERFFRGGDVNSRRTRGSGLGIAFVTEVLRMHGSELNVWSEVGTGSRFSFTLAPESPQRSKGLSRPSERESRHLGRADLYR